MPQVRTLAPAEGLHGIVAFDKDNNRIDLRAFADRIVKRATRVGDHVIVHVVGSLPGEKIVFQTTDEYERAIRREFVSS